MSGFLLALVVLAWGFSWYAITLQLGPVSALVALAYRFVLAAGVMCAGLAVTGRWRWVPMRDQPTLAALGLCLFSLNFVCFYLAAWHLPSGLLSVVFATASIFGALNAWLFLDRPIERRVVLAALLGVVGLALLLGPEGAMAAGARPPLWAFLLPVLGTYLFSLGNLLSLRLSRQHALPNVVGQGMVWGAVILLGLCVVFGQTFALPASARFWGGTAFLALVASVLAFLTYLTLVNRVGAARASYATVLFPIVAMLVSTWAEGYAWSAGSVVGLTMALGGTYLAFSKA